MKVRLPRRTHGSLDRTLLYSSPSSSSIVMTLLVLRWKNLNEWEL
jgi:hypothetical protein